MFTTHTPVPAGHDVFPFDLMDKYFGDYYPGLGLSREDFFDLGRNPADPDAGFNMTAFALRLSAYHNGVSVKHGEVSRHMWQSLWPETPEDQVPIDLDHQRGARAHLDLPQDRSCCSTATWAPDWLEDARRSRGVGTGG